MECERLTKLIKSWYIQVKDEALAPARMVDFMRAHLTGCPVCLSDSAVESEVKKIIEIILPAAKIPKAVIREEDSDYEDDSSVESGEDQDEDDVQSEDGDDEEEEIDELEDDDI